MFHIPVTDNLTCPVRIAKGEQISIPIASFNRDKKIWGEDADEFKYVPAMKYLILYSHWDMFRPERWLDPSTHPKPAETPGVFAALMTFIGGTRSCVSKILSTPIAHITD